MICKYDFFHGDDINLRPLDLVEKFITGLSVQAIPYCHWKSTTNIEASLRGETDLDLLVAPECREACLALLDKLGFYQASNPWELDLPGISHYFGYDRPSGCLVHVHLHFQLIVGDDLLKNYRIPAEKVFFNSAITVNHIAVPAPEVEFIIFVLRMVLKRRLLAFVARLLFLMGNVKSLLRQVVGLETPQLPPGSQTEFDDLREKISEERLIQILQAGFPFVSIDLFRQCRDSLENSAPRFAWLTVGNQLARTLADYRRLTGFAAVGKMFSQGFKLRIRAVLALVGCRGLTGKTPNAGGRIIAVVGGDCAVKDDLGDDLAQWLGSYFSVAKLRLDKLDAGSSGATAQVMMKAWGLLPRKTDASFVRSACSWLEERGRHRIYRKAIRLRRRGMVVLLDSTPLSANGELSHTSTAGFPDHYKNEWLKGINVDELVMLKSDPPITCGPLSEGAEGLGPNTSRKEIPRHWPSAIPHFVDPANPFPEVVFQVRSLVWDFLGRERKEL